MLSDEDITFNEREYKNTFQFLKSLIKDETLNTMSATERGTLIKVIKKKMSIK